MLTLIRHLRRSLALLFVAAALLLPAAAQAASSSKTTKSSTASGSGTDSANNQVTQGYGTSQPLQKGMIVKLVDKDPTKVEAVTTATVAKMQGVVVAANDAAFALGNSANAGQVFVATTGHYDVLVSNQNGPIKSGDYITISALAGIGMKDNATAAAVLGRATAAFDGSSNVSGTATLKDSTGRQVKVSIGRIPVDINAGHNPLQQTGEKSVPGFLRTAAQLVSGKPLNATRIYLGLFVLVATTLISAIMLFS
ncbi:MAG TPA: hypothetical protein VFH39_01720, partial [Candidatus Saccharimonadales bacterium]|nr:hypothetical protein [Candidatus Saccharimonadales bacterium]